MGKPAEKEPSHMSKAPALQCLSDTIPIVSSDAATFSSGTGGVDALDASSELRAGRTGSLGLRVSDRTSPPLDSGATGVPPPEPVVPPLPDPRYDAVVSTKSSGVRTQTSIVGDPVPKPRVKTCILCAGGDLPTLPDSNLILQSLARAPNIDREHTTTHTDELIGTTLDEFFDPADICEGGMLILIVSCHGRRGYDDTVSLQFSTRNGKIVDSRVLQEKIMALPKYCTLEIIADTCFAEGLVPGLSRISTTDRSVCTIPAETLVASSATAQMPLSGSRSSTRVTVSSASSSVEPNSPFPVRGLLKHVSPFFEEGQPKYKAQVVVWAASAQSGLSFTEEDLPQRPRAYSIMIGAIFSYFGSNGPNISRRDVWNNVLQVVEQHNDARRERDLRKPPEKQASLIRENRIQRPILLTSLDDPDHILNGSVFLPIETSSK